MSIMNRVQCNRAGTCKFEMCVHSEPHKVTFEYYGGIEPVPGESAPCTIQMECRLSGHRVSCIPVAA